MSVAHIHGVGSGPSYRENENAYQRWTSDRPIKSHARGSQEARRAFQDSTGDTATFQYDFERCILLKARSP